MDDLSSLKLGNQDHGADDGRPDVRPPQAAEGSVPEVQEDVDEDRETSDTDARQSETREKRRRQGKWRTKSVVLS